MLIEFKASNYRSIAEEQVISFVPATGQTDFPSNIIEIGKHKVLNALALYGPNNSGKTNILKSIEILDRLLSLSGRFNSTTKLPYDPNLLISGFSNRPTKFEITFLIDEIRYRYGIEYDLNNIQKEWLFRKNIGREVELFYREGDIIEVSSGFNGAKRLIDTAIESTKNNGLFLSNCDIFNVDEAKTIFNWFHKLINVDGLDTRAEELNTINLLDDNSEYRDQIIKHLISLDLGFDDIILQKKEIAPNELPDNIDPTVRQSLVQELSGKTGIQVNTVRSIFNPDGSRSDNSMVWSMEQRESAGTKKAFSISGPVVYSLLNGGVLVIDEIEARMHTRLTTRIVDLFLSKETNPLNAQLVFATHDTNLLKFSNLRRDQINFTETNELDATEVFSLSDMRYFDQKGTKERPDTDKEKRYLEGRYGAVPNLQKIDQIKDLYTNLIHNGA